LYSVGTVQSTIRLRSPRQLEVCLYKQIFKKTIVLWRSAVRMGGWASVRRGVAWGGAGMESAPGAPRDCLRIPRARYTARGTVIGIPLPMCN
jgi:hypothetical protein